MARKKNTDDQSPDNTPDNNNDETFGLPEIEYQPINRDETTHSTTETTSNMDPNQNQSYHNEPQRDYVPEYEDEDEGSPWPKILGILAIVAVAGLAYWFFGIYQPARKAERERERTEQEARDAAARRAEEERQAELDRQAAEQRRADSLANLQSKEGTIETLSERTRRYYVVIASAVDGDLLMDHAKKLSVQGVSTKIIPPFGKHKFYRLAVAEGDTYTETQTTADGLKGQYGEGVWVIRY